MATVSETFMVRDEERRAEVVEQVFKDLEFVQPREALALQLCRSLQRGCIQTAVTVSVYQPLEELLAATYEPRKLDETPKKD